VSEGGIEWVCEERVPDGSGCGLDGLALEACVLGAWEGA